MAARREFHLFGWANELFKIFKFSLRFFCSGRATKKDLNNQYYNHSKVRGWKDDIKCQRN